MLPRIASVPTVIAPLRAYAESTAERKFFSIIHELAEFVQQWAQMALVVTPPPD
jgi:hypothetical protein